MTYRLYSLCLKEIQKVCDIKSIPSLTSHTARKYYGDMFLNNAVSPVSIETVSKGLAHSKITTTQKSYTDIDLNRMAFEIIKTGLW